MYLLEGLWGQERTKALEGSNYPQSAGAKLGSLFTSRWPQIHLNPGAQTMSSEVYVSSLVAQLVKNLPAMQETWVRSLGWKDPLEKRKATPSSILSWRIPWTV